MYDEWESGWQLFNSQHFSFIISLLPSCATRWSNNKLLNP